jgi:hypothetical protein
VVSSQEEFEARYNTHSTAEETVIWDIADKQVRNNRYEQAVQWCESSSALRDNSGEKGDPTNDYCTDELATHPAFAKFGSKNLSQCRR